MTGFLEQVPLVLVPSASKRMMTCVHDSSGMTVLPDAVNVPTVACTVCDSRYRQSVRSSLQISGMTSVLYSIGR